MLDNLESFDEEEKEEIFKNLSGLEETENLEGARDDLVAFCCAMQDDYKVGKHHRILADLLMDIEAGITENVDGTYVGLDRVAVNIPPRHGKSQMGTIYYSAWYLGRNPTHKVMLVSHTSDLAVDFGRKVRNLINTPLYRSIFPNVQLAKDSKSAGRWNTNHGGEFYATGIGSNIAGRGADLLLIDDPHSEQDVLAGNFSVFAKAYDWYAYGARTRLMPGGRVVIIQCMTGDTGVLLATGKEKPLRDVRVGDEIATYDGGKLTSARVLNWANQGSDQVYTIAMSDGKLVRANERHPFLVQKPDGSTTWTRVKKLEPGMQLVSLRDATGHQGRKQTVGTACVTLAKQESATTRKSLMRRNIPLGTGARTKAKFVLLRDAVKRLVGMGVVLAMRHLHITTSAKSPATIIAQTNDATPTSNSSMASTLLSITDYWVSKSTNALFACSESMRLTSQKVGARLTLSPLTIATTLAGSEDFYATTATSLSNTTLTRNCCSGQFTTSTIASITLTGREDVFDIEVEGTHNFIANQVVSSNTRWHQDDITGRVVKDMAMNDGADQFHVVEFPAIFEIETVTYTNAAGKLVSKEEIWKDKHTAVVEKPLWPEFFSLAALHRTKASMPLFQWNSQYQQNPTAEEAAIIKRDDWNIWMEEEPPECLYVIMTVDAAAEKHNRADFSAITVWGVFMNEEENENHVILLDAVRERVEFHELKALALRHYKARDPDSFIVEKKSSGVPLYQELRRMGIPVQEYTPVRGSGDKIARLNGVADMVNSRKCWVPQTRWAEALVDEVASFPYGSNDDLVDCTSMALKRFRDGGFVRLPSDEPEPEKQFKSKRRSFY